MSLGPQTQAKTGATPPSATLTSVSQTSVVFLHSVDKRRFRKRITDFSGRGVVRANPAVQIVRNKVRVGSLARLKWTIADRQN